MLRSFIPFLLASLGFTLIASTINMPLLEWQVSEIDTNLPPEFHINPTWTTKPGESLESESYILNQVVMIMKNGNSCSPEQLTYVVRRSRSDEMLEKVALNVNQRITQWLTGLALTGQSTMAVILLLCGMYIWWFTSWYNRPFSEAIISTVVAVILLTFLINVWRVLVPEVGVFICPGQNGIVTLNARLLRVHYETLFLLFAGIFAEIGALGIIVRQIRRTITEGKEASKSTVG